VGEFIVTLICLGFIIAAYRSSKNNREIIKFRKEQTIPHKCEHCNNTIYINPIQQEMIDKGGTVDCLYCHKWTH
jgi:hypothetical protein